MYCMYALCFMCSCIVFYVFMYFLLYASVCFQRSSTFKSHAGHPNHHAFQCAGKRTPCGGCTWTVCSTLLGTTLWCWWTAWLESTPGSSAWWMSTRCPGLSFCCPGERNFFYAWREYLKSLKKSPWAHFLGRLGLNFGVFFSFKYVSGKLCHLYQTTSHKWPRGSTVWRGDGPIV